MNKKMILPLAAACLLFSCASTVHRGVVAMKVDDSTAHVSMGQNEVSVGDHVELYSNKCKNKKLIEEPVCERVAKGHGAVTSVINNDYVVIKFDSGVTFQEGDFIEKHSH